MRPVATTGFGALLLMGCAGELRDDESAYLAALQDDAGMGAPQAFESEPDPTAAGGAGCPDVTVIFEASCTSGICHDAEAPASGLDLASPGLEARLVDAKAACGGRVLIDSESPAESFLIEKLSSPSPECGSKMPLGGQLADADLACVEAWVTSLGGSSDGGQP